MEYDKLTQASNCEKTAENYNRGRKKPDSTFRTKLRLSSDQLPC